MTRQRCCKHQIWTIFSTLSLSMHFFWFCAPRFTIELSRMDYKYLVVVDPSTCDTESLCHGVPLRMHADSYLKNIGTIRAQEDWSWLVKNVQNYRGGLGPKFNFMSVSVPECLPDRLEIISYANEFAFLHDGILYI